MPREPTEADVLKLSQLIVESWEKIPATVNSFCSRFGEQYREVTEDMLRETAGGEELYLASKSFLEGR